MAVVTVLPQSRPLTRADLESMPDDGHRYELIDGALLVTPAPRHLHQRAVVNLTHRLVDVCPNELEVLVAPFDVALTHDTVMQPDVLVARRSDITDRDLPVAPLLAVETLSPSTRLIDLNLKYARYEQASCPSYWVVDPDEPSITAWELVGGSYRQVCTATGEEKFSVSKPFPVTLQPRDLVR